MDELRCSRTAAVRSNAAPAAILQYVKASRASHLATNPVEVYQLTTKLLHSTSAKALSEADLWSVREDRAIACIQLGRTEEALSIVNLVAQRFPRSCRAARLKGMYLESLKKFDEALATYDAALHLDPDNLMIVHRLAALKAGRGELSGALKDLHKHLDTYIGDYQAWYEAGKLHAKQGAYARAVFCFEEVLMHHAGDTQLILTIADCLYACGGVDNLSLAKKYYAIVVELSGGGSVKALLGVCQCNIRLAEYGSEEHGEEQTKNDTGEANDGRNSLGALAADALMSEYVLKGSVWAGAMAALLRK